MGSCGHEDSKRQATSRQHIGNISEKVQAVVNGKRYTVIRGMQPGSIPPKGPFRLGTIVVEALPGEYVFLWRLSANNEDFPQGDKLGEFAIKLLPSTNEKAQ